jgi:hypothetical protein
MKWRGVSVLDHLLSLLAERDLRLQQRFEAQSEAISAALLAAKEAVIKAELSMDKRIELLNELRVGVATKEEIEALEKIVNELSKRLNTLQGRATGIGAGWGYLMTAIGAVAALVGIYLAVSR